ncbi:hypothetical protein LTR66_017450, partial [Elasticomyces elasticus]
KDISLQGKVLWSNTAKAFSCERTTHNTNSIPVVNHVGDATCDDGRHAPEAKLQSKSPTSNMSSAESKCHLQEGLCALEDTAHDDFIRLQQQFDNQIAEDYCLRDEVEGYFIQFESIKVQSRQREGDIANMRSLVKCMQAQDVCHCKGKTAHPVATCRATLDLGVVSPSFEFVENLGQCDCGIGDEYVADEVNMSTSDTETAFIRSKGSQRSGHKHAARRRRDATTLEAASESDNRTTKRSETCSPPPHRRKPGAKRRRLDTTSAFVSLTPVAPNARAGIVNIGAGRSRGRVCLVVPEGGAYPLQRGSKEVSKELRGLMNFNELAGST